MRVLDVCGGWKWEVIPNVGVPRRTWVVLELKQPLLGGFGFFSLGFYLMKWGISMQMALKFLLLYREVLASEAT